MYTDNIPTLPDLSARWGMSQKPSPGWPYMRSAELQAAPASLGYARRLARAATRQWGLRALSDDVELIVSELVTNAIEAEYRTPGWQIPPVRLWLASDLNAILVQVWDDSSELPVCRSPALTDERGRGLMLVGCVCRAWGTYPKNPGKVVWAVL